VVVLVLVFLVSSCQTGNPIVETATNNLLTTPPKATPSTQPTPLPTNTPVVQLADVEIGTDSEEPNVQPSPVPDPLRFVFPTPGAVPVSAWRPPLYPTPWAPTPFDHFYFARPIAANEINSPLADYRYGGVFLPEVVHTGIDIPAPIGTEVMAAGSGKVTWAGYGLYRGIRDPNDPYGLAVTIKHEFGYQGQALYTVYGHLDQIDVVVGQYVETGEVVGLVGQTGKVTGPHLHFEVRVGRNNFFGSRNPELWLAPPQGWGILAARILNSKGELLPSHLIKLRSLDNQQSWNVKSYGVGTVISDGYYRENLVLGDLPAGRYEVWVPYEGSTYNLEIDISPGRVSYFTFHGRGGFHTEIPATPGTEFIPPEQTLTPNP